MNYARYYNCDMVNGPGIRSVLFVQGCTHECRGCYNQSTWNPDNGQEFTQELEDQIIRDLQDQRINRSGLTLTGGDPLHENNLVGVLRLIRRVREECPDKTIWMWTGYTLEELQTDRSSVGIGRRVAVMNVDTLIDGRFVQELHDPTLKWRGSSNQNVINIKEI